MLDLLKETLVWLVVYPSKVLIQNFVIDCLATKVLKKSGFTRVDILQFSSWWTSFCLPQRSRNSPRNVKQFIFNPYMGA